MDVHSFKSGGQGEAGLEGHRKGWNYYYGEFGWESKEKSKCLPCCPKGWEAVGLGCLCTGEQDGASKPRFDLIVTGSGPGHHENNEGPSGGKEGPVWMTM